MTNLPEFWMAVGLVCLALGQSACRAPVSLLDQSEGRAVEAAVVARDAWVREPLASRTEAALFVVLENRSSERRSIVAAASDTAAKVEMHEMKVTGSMMTMSPAARIDLGAQGTTELKSGGSHIMLFGLKRHPVAGESIAVALTLDSGETVSVRAEVRKLETIE